MSEESKIILLVDDDEDQLLLFQTLLRQTEARVYTARSAKEGFDMLKEVQPDVIICDVMMPNISGRDLMKRLRADPRTRNVPIIAYSTLPREVEEDVLAYGATVFCSKTEARKLLGEVKKHLR